jgi:hypothetical protein
MSDLQALMEGAIDAVAIRSANSFTWFGQPSVRLRAAVERALTPKMIREFLVYNLQLQLYSGFYCRGAAVARLPEPAATPQEVGSAHHIRELSKANSGAGFWAAGWQAVEVDGRTVSVLRDGLMLRASLAECQPAAGGQIVPGASVRVRLLKEFRGASPGFYVALGDQELESDPLGLLRFYWNATPKGAVELMRRLTESLNRAAVPFRLKAAKQPEDFTRCDNVVLYLRKTDYAAALSCVEASYSQIASQLQHGIPVFTKFLAPSLALAENPPGSDSFGMHRCRLMADGLVRAHERRQRSLAPRYQAVLERFGEEGISLERPYLNPRSSDQYTFSCRATGRSTVVLAAGPETRHPNYLTAAAAIGNRIVAEAQWHEDRCNWLGFTTPEAGTSDIRAAVSFGALGPELYGGTSGVALFLAELWRSTGDSPTRRTAMAAIRHSLSKLEATPQTDRIGLHTGWSGIAMAAGRMAQIFGQQELQDAALALQTRCSAEEIDDDRFDLLSGRAGAIVAVLALRSVVGGPVVPDCARKWGEQLLQTAVRSQQACSWGSAMLRGRRRLTGFSHGTAGVGSALLELYRASEEERFREAAEGAFEYERQWFDHGAGNWPDFRGDARPASAKSGSIPCSTAWCHGAPGIVLSRLRASNILTDPQLWKEIEVGVGSTYRATQLWASSEAANYSLCHGLAGNAEVLISAADALGATFEPASRLAEEIAAIGIHQYLEPGKVWPCGVAGGENHSLMLGLAGIGYFYLRMNDRAVPSLLLLHGDSFCRGKAQLKKSVGTT